MITIKRVNANGIMRDPSIAAHIGVFLKVIFKSEKSSEGKNTSDRLTNIPHKTSADIP